MHVMWGNVAKLYLYTNVDINTHIQQAMKAFTSGIHSDKNLSEMNEMVKSC